MVDKALSTREGALWVQPAGPNTPVYFLGCHDLGDITESMGSVELQRCMNKKGGWKTVGSLTSPPDAVTTSIENLTFSVRDWLEKLSCEFTLFHLHRECGEPDIFNNYKRALILNNARVTSIVNKGLAHHSDEVGSTQSRDIEAWPPLIRTGDLTLRRQTTSETKDINDMYTYVPVNCLVDCPAPGLTALAVTDSSTYDEDVLRTLDGGATWTILAGEPFVKGENVITCCAFPISSTITRLLVGQIAVATNTGRVSYSDDNGATWAEVVFTGINGHGAGGHNSLFALDQGHIWLASAKGYIYFSSDGGATWVKQTQGTLSIKDGKSIYFADESNGMAGFNDDIIMKTSDGGLTWSLTAAVTGGGVGCHINAIYKAGDFWWVGTETGKLFYSNDVGATWTERTFPNSGVGKVADLVFANDLVGYLLRNSAAPLGEILVTINGGYTWRAMVTPANSGLNSLAVADENTVYACGDANGGTAVILKATWD